MIFQWPERRRNGTLARGALIALACGAGTAAAVTAVFQEIFLVRLP
jgi:diaminopimelate epimerase